MSRGELAPEVLALTITGAFVFVAMLVVTIVMIGAFVCVAMLVVSHVMDCYIESRGVKIANRAVEDELEITVVWDDGSEHKHKHNNTNTHKNTPC
jgi:hypothetical protein